MIKDWESRWTPNQLHDESAEHSEDKGSLRWLFVVGVVMLFIYSAIIFSCATQA